MVKRKDGTSGPMVDRRGYLVPVADLDETFVKQNVNKKTYAAFEGRPVKNEYDVNPAG
jgi:hypothetical protein